VLERRYGLEGRAATIDVVARELGVSRAKVSAIETRALERLSHERALAGPRREPGGGGDARAA
jgi:DNA-directed RNA polymerase sigma subunit (sigma70/sigma32)